MSIQLSREDYDYLRDMLLTLREFREERGRNDFVDDIFAGSPRRNDVVSLLDMGGTPRSAAIRLINRLCQFGQDEPGQETLGILVNRVRSYVGSEEGDKLAAYFDRYALTGEPTALRPIEGEWHGREHEADVAEKVIGENTLRDIRMLELALEASAGVVRICRSGVSGTGFLVGEQLIMTNHHVIATRAEAISSSFEFNHQLDRHGNESQRIAIAAKVGGLFYTSPRKGGLDMTIIEIEASPEGVRPLKLKRQRILRDDRVNIIQHPNGRFKKISLQNNFVVYADKRILQYVTTTEPGSSGSPVCNNDFAVVGLHHSGGSLREPGTERRYLRNGGSSMIAILTELQQNALAIYQRLTLA